MGLATSEGLRADLCSAPGETSSDVLRARNMSVEEFAAQAGQTALDAHDLISGRMAISLTVARRLVAIFGGSVEFWMARDFQFQGDSSRLEALDKEWIRDFPLRDVIDRNWLDPPTPRDKTAACVPLFNVRSVRAARQPSVALDA